MSDQEIKCKDCPTTFTFTAGEQAFFTERNFTTPVRCKPCRDKRKAEKEGRDNGGGHISGGSYVSSPAPRPVVVETAPPARGGGRKGGGGGKRRDAWDD
jgi:uncharacterized membrane protein YgcG